MAMGIDEPGIYSLTARIHHLVRLISAHDVLVGTHGQDTAFPHRKSRRLAERAVDSIAQAMMQDHVCRLPDMTGKKRDGKDPCQKSLLTGHNGNNCLPTNLTEIPPPGKSRLTHNSKFIIHNFPYSAQL